MLSDGMCVSLINSFFESNAVPCVFRRHLNFNPFFSVLQIPFEGCDSRQDLLLTGPDQDQAHGSGHHQEGDHGLRTQHIPRQRNDSKVRNTPQSPKTVPHSYDNSFRQLISLRNLFKISTGL